MAKKTAPMGALDTRFYHVNLETRTSGDGANEIGTVRGVPIVFNSRTNLGYFDEIIDPHALDECDLSDVRLCLNHDTSYVYARSRRNNPKSTMRLQITATGMPIEADLAIGRSAKAADFYTAVGRGDIDQMSFMFRIDGEEWEDLETDHPLRRITKISSVVEVSAVTFPAYTETSIEINERSKEALESARAAVETARTQARRGDASDELELLKAKIMIL
jgi:HK97 family phage prohead protease